MNKIQEIRPVWVEIIPDELEEGVLYISEKYGTAIHLCACGCKGKTVIRIKSYWGDGWDITKNQNKITVRPSIGNWSGQHPYHAHYYITDDQIEWLDNVNMPRESGGSQRY